MRLPSKKILRIATAVASAGAVGLVIGYVPAAGWTTNDVTTGVTPGYPDLKTRRYDLDINATTLYASEAARRLRGWNVKRTDPQAGIVEAEVAVPSWLHVFTDDVIVTIRPDSDLSSVSIRSHSRLGRGDLGENARHIRALQAAMDTRLPPAS